MPAAWQTMPLSSSMARRKTRPAGNPYVVSDECWMGKIDHKDPNKIEWSKLPAHPGPGRFGIVAGAE